jgi:hypothetical protein
MQVMWHLKSICLTIVIPFFKFSVHLPPSVLQASWNVMAHVQKPDIVSWQNGRAIQISRGISSVDYWQPRCAYQLLLLAVMLDTGSAKGTGYPLYSPVSPSLPLPCLTVCHHISTAAYPRLYLTLSNAYLCLQFSCRLSLIPAVLLLEKYFIFALCMWKHCVKLLGFQSHIIIVY